MAKLHVIDAARIAFEVNRRFRDFIGEEDLGSWGEISEEKRASIVKVAQYALDNPSLSPRENHDHWSQHYVNAAHPNKVDWNALPEPQQIKDVLFLGVINALRPFVVDEP